MSELNEPSMAVLFGDLRALLQQTTPDADELLSILSGAYALDPNRYQSEWLPYLESFDLPMCQATTMEMLAHLNVVLPQKTPREFFYPNRGMESEEFASLLPVLKATPCTSLVLYGNNLNPHDMLILAHAPGLAHVQHLDLSSNTIQDSGVSALAQSDQLNMLQSLDVSYNDLIEAEGIQALMLSSLAAQLRVLDVSSNLLGAVGGLAFGLAPESAPLSELLVDTCDIGDVGLAAIFNASFGSRLKKLGLSNNQLCDDDLLMWASHQSLEWLGLQYNNLTGECLPVLSSIPSLETLYLGGNPLGDQGAQMLAAVEHWPGLRVLNLSHSSIGNDGLEALSHSTGFDGLQSLVLVGNGFDDKGLIHLANSTAFPALQDLYLMNNTMGRASAERLRQSDTLPSGLRVHVSLSDGDRLIWKVGDVS